MKIPEPPPNKDLGKITPDKIRSIVNCGPVDSKGRYLHWEKLKHLTPPFDLTPEEWWMGVKFARQHTYKKLRLVDKENKNFVFSIPDCVLRDLHWLDQNTSGSLFGDTDLVNQQLKTTYLIRSFVEEAINSSQLEGAATTRKMAKEMIRQGRKPKDKSEHMILNNYHAMQFIKNYVDDPLTPSMILELHRILTKDTLDNPNDAGQYRKQTDDIHVVNGQGDILYTPPKAEELPERIKRICEFANDEESDIFIHPIIKAILLHFIFAYDHPFVDGNGRTARALFYWLIARKKYWLLEYVSISRIIKRAPAQYGIAFLHTETDENDATYFIIHQLEIIRQAVDDLRKFLSKKAREIKAAEKLLESTSQLKGKLNYRQIALLRHAFKNPGYVYKINEHQQSHGVAYDTARNDLLLMSDKLGLLIKKKEKKTYVFVSPNDLPERIRGKKL